MDCDQEYGTANKWIGRIDWIILVVAGLTLMAPQQESPVVSGILLFSVFLASYRIGQANPEVEED